MKVAMQLTKVEFMSPPADTSPQLAGAVPVDPQLNFGLLIVSACDLLKRALTDLAAAAGFAKVATSDALDPDHRSVGALDDLAVHTAGLKVLVVTPVANGLPSVVRWLRSHNNSAGIATYNVVVDDEAVLADLACGVDAALSAGDTVPMLVRKLAGFAEGRPVNSTAVRGQARTLSRNRECERALADHLAMAATPAESQVLQLLATGISTRQIARQMGVVPATVNTYVKRLLAKFAVTNRVELLLTAIRLGIIEVR